MTAAITRRAEEFAQHTGAPMAFAVVVAEREAELVALNGQPSNLLRSILETHTS